MRKASIARWVDTEASLRFHLKSGKLPKDLRKEFESEISWICGPLPKVPETPAVIPTETKPVIPQTVPAFSQPSTSSSAENFVEISQPSPKTLDFFMRLENSEDELQEFIASLDVITQLKMEAFSKKFYNIAIHSGQKIAATVQLARIFNDSLNSQNPEESFRKTFRKTLLTKFSELPDDDAVIFSQAKVLIEFIVELYKIGWIEGEFVTSLMDGLAENNFEMYQLDLFLGLLQTALMTMVVNGDCGRFDDYLKILERKKEISKTMKSILMCDEVIGMLETALMLSNGAERFNELQVHEVLINIDKDSATKIRKLPMKTAKDFKIFTEVFIEKAAAGVDDAIDCSKLAGKIQNFKVAGIKFKELLIEKCQEKILKFLGSGKIEQLSSTIGFLHFVGELYVKDIMNFDLVNLCFELLDDYGSDDTLDCFRALLKTVGAKVEKENIEKLSEIYEKFEKKTECKSGYPAAVLQEMNELRENEWKQDERDDEKNFEGTTEDILVKLSTLDIENAADSLSQLLKTSEGIEKLIQAIWKLTLTKNDPKIYAKLCVELANNHEEFSQLLTDFLRRRNAAFQFIRKDQFTEVIINSLINVLTFVTDLFVQSVLSDADYEPWIQMKLVRQLPQAFNSLLISEIEQKISKSENVRLKAGLRILEGIEHERAMVNMQELSQNIKEITNIVHNLKENQTVPTAESIQIKII